MDDRLREGCRHAAKQVEQKELDVAQDVLDRVPEHPQEQYVAGYVYPVGVYEHRRKDVADTEIVRLQAIRRHEVLLRGGVERELVHKHKYIRDDQPDGDYRPGVARLSDFDRDEHLRAHDRAAKFWQLV